MTYRNQENDVSKSSESRCSRNEVDIEDRKELFESSIWVLKIFIVEHNITKHNYIEFNLIKS